MYLFVSVHVRIDFASFSRSGHVDEFESVSFQFVLRPEVSLFGCVGVAMSNDRNVSAACPSNTAAPNGKPPFRNWKLCQSLYTHRFCVEEAGAGSTTVMEALTLLIVT